VGNYDEVLLLETGQTGCKVMGPMLLLQKMYAEIAETWLEVKRSCANKLLGV